MPSFLSKCGTITSPASTGQVTYTVTGFGGTPKVLILWGALRNSDNITADARFSYGIGVSSAKRAAICATSSHGVATSVSQQRHDNTKVFTHTALTSTTVLLAADLVSFGVSGNDGQFTLNWTTNSLGSGYIINYCVLGGDDLEANLIEAQQPAATSTQNVAHGLSAAPTALLAFSANYEAAPPAGTSTAAIDIGACDVTTARKVSAASLSGLATSDTSRRSEAVLLGGTGGNIAVVSAVDGMNIDIGWTKTDATQRYFWILALTGVSAKVGTFNTPTSGTSQSITGAGFKPRVLLPFSFMGTTAAGSQDNARLMFGGDDGSNAAVAGFLDEDNQADTDADRFQDSDKSLQIYDHTPTLKLEGQVYSFDSDGFTMHYTTVDAATAYEVAYLALGPLEEPKPVKIVTGTLTTPASTGNQTYTVPGLGTTPKALILFTGATSLDISGTGVHFGFGAGVSSTKRAAVGIASLGNAATSVAHRRRSNTKILTLTFITSTGTAYEADLVSFGISGDDGQFTLNWTTVQPGQILVSYIAIGGDDVEANLIELAVPASTGVQTYAHGLAATPTALINFGIALSSATATANEATPHLGVWGDGNQHAVACSSENARATSDTMRLSSSGDFIRPAWTEATLFAASVSGVDATNISLNWSAGHAGAQAVYILALAGVSAKVGTANTPTAAATQSITTTFTPTHFLPLSFMGATAAGVQDDARLMIGSDDGTNAVVAGCLDQDAQDTTNSDRFQDSDKSIQIYDHAQTLKLEGRVSQFLTTASGGSVEIEYDTVDATTSYEIAYLILGDNAHHREYPADGTISLTGEGDLAITQDHQIAPADGSIALSGEGNVVLGQTHVLTVDAGTIALAGEAVAITQNHQLAVDAGSIALTGEGDVAIEQTHVLTIADGVIALSGEGDLALSQTHVLVIANGSIGLTGEAVTIVVPTETSLSGTVRRAVAFVPGATSAVTY